MIGADVSVGHARFLDEPLGPSIIQDRQVLEVDSIEQGGPDQNLVEHIPEVRLLLGMAMKEGAGRAARPVSALGRKN